MESLLTMFHIGKGEAKAIEAVLARLEKRQLAVRVELEHSLIRFETRLAVKRNAVVVAKPPALGKQLQTGHYVRFRVPDEPRHEIRMEVVTPHFNLANDQPAFLCRMPTAFAPPSKRKGDRFDTSRFTNLRLELPGQEGEFRILDISEHGCRVQTPYTRPREHLPLAAQIGNAVVLMGRNVKVGLAKIVPRDYQGTSVGMSFAVDPGGDNRKLLLHLLRSLETAQHDALKAEHD
jgi:hypothetical protein